MVANSVRLFIQEQSELNERSRTNPDSEAYRESQWSQQAQDTGSMECRVMKRVIPIRRKAERELVVNDDNQRSGIQVIPTNKVRSLLLGWQKGKGMKKR
jgi:hypothetical protein